MRFTEPTEANLAAWKAWLAERPWLHEAVERLHLEPWTLYRMKSTGQRVYILSFFEPDPDGKIRCRVGVSGDFNVLAFERDVFGIDVEDLVECDLPAPGEPVGSADLDKILGPEEMFKLADELRSKKS